jgi:hypothetical protein
MSRTAILKLDIEAVRAAGRDVYFDGDDNVVAQDEPRAAYAYFASTDHFESVGIEGDASSDAFLITTTALPIAPAADVEMRMADKLDVVEQLMVGARLTDLTPGPA